MDTQLLIGFIVAAEQQSFSRAGDVLGLSQSAVSKRIALLEKEIDALLFDRIGRSIVLTEAGTDMLPRAKRVIQELQDTQQFMRDRKGQVSGQLRIAASHHIGIHRLPETLRQFTQQYPDVHFRLHFIDSEQATQAILKDEYDLALITLSDDILTNKNEAIQSHTIWEDPIFFVCNRQHPLNQLDHITLTKLADFPAILPDINTQTTHLIRQRFIEQKIPLDIAMTTNHLDAIKMMISVGLGWSVLPNTLITQELSRLTTNQPPLIRQLGCIYHRERTLSNAARAMLRLLREVSR